MRVPTSAPRTGSLALPSFARKFRVRLFLATSSLFQGFSVVLGCASSGSPIPVEWGHHRCVDSELGATVERETVRHNPKTPAIQPVVLCQIHVAHEQIRPNSGSSFSADPCRNGLQRPAPAPQHARCCASCTVVAKGVEWTATPAVATDRGRGRRSLRRRSTRKGAGSNLDVLSTGKTEKRGSGKWNSLRPHHGPVRFHQLRPHRDVVKIPLIAELACFCLFLLSRVRCMPLSQLRPCRAFETYMSSHGRMALLRHFEFVCPACPVGCRLSTTCTPKSKPALPQRQRRLLLSPTIGKICKMREKQCHTP